MKVTAWYEPEPRNVEVNVGVDEIRAALAAEPESKVQAVVLVNGALQALLAITDELVDQMEAGVRKAVAEHLAAQAARFGGEL